MHRYQVSLDRVHPKSYTRNLDPLSISVLIVIYLPSLAYAELYLTIATVFRRVDIQLFETMRDDVVIVRDAFIGNPKESSNGVRVTVGTGGGMGG